MSSRKKRKSLNQGVSDVQPMRKGVRNDTNRPTSEKLQTAFSASANEIKRLISKGKNKAAVSKAKQYHKSFGTQESEMILVDAYVARIREMIAKGYNAEAKTLLELVRGRYNCPDHRIIELNAMISVHQGRIDELVRPLTDPGIPQEQRTAIEKIIKNELVDLSLLARCEVLPAGHPLKSGAQAVAEAFAKVTSGFIGDEDIVLPMISRRSPLAPWKMLIKALACFYRHDDEICAKYLRAVDPESAPGRLVPIMREMVADKSNGNHGENSSFLVEKITGNSKKIRDALRMLDGALAANKPRKLFNAARNAVNICKQSCPELVDRLKQHISIRSWLLGVDAEEVNRALGGPSLKNAYFWRLHARAADMKGKHLWACALLEEFRKHALHEGWFSDKSKEVSAIYLYMADLVQRLPAKDLEWCRSDFEMEFTGFESYYHGQPGSVLEAVRKDTRSPSDAYFLYPDHLYRLAGEIDPAAETFRQWLEWTENNDTSWKKSDAVAVAWHAAIPDDTRPLLYLMKSAEKRNAFKKALGYLEKAECLDGLDPDVNRARLRLLAAIAIRHLKQKKINLAQKDFAEIEVLPHSGEGDRPAFLVALKSVCAVVNGQKSELSRFNNELIALLETSLTAKMVIQGLLKACGLSDRVADLPAYPNETLEGHDFMAAVARGCKLGDDMGVAVAIPPEYEKKTYDLLTTGDRPHDAANIRIIAETALRNSNSELAYAAAAAGLLIGGATTAGFLLLRAKSLPAWEIIRRDDCIMAAVELARRERDMDLLDEAIELRRDAKGSPFGFSIFNHMTGEGNSSMGGDELNEVLQREREAREYPSSRSMDFFNDLDDADNDGLEDSQCKYCDANNCPDRDAPFRPNALYDEDFDEDDEDNDFNDILTFDDALDDSLPDPHELTQKDSKPAEQIQLKLFEAKVDGTLPDRDHNWFPGTGRRSRQSERN